MKNFKEEFALGFTEGTVNPNDYTFVQKSPIYEANEPDTDFRFGALLQDTLPYKVGISASFAVDEMIRSLDPDDPLQQIDQSFKPFEIFKNNGHSEHEFDEIMGMENYEQYARYMERKAFKRDVKESVAAGGLPASAASFVLNLGTDPTLYFGFGLTKMVASGISRAKAGAVAGFASGASYETMEQIADPERTAIDAAHTLFFSTALGGVMGKAVDSFYGLKNKGKLQYASNIEPSGNTVKDFENVVARHYEPDARTLDQRAEAIAREVAATGDLPASAGAMATPLDILEAAPTNEIAGTLARVTGKIISPLVPKLRFQTSKYAATRDAGETFFGLAARSQRTEAGIATKISVVQAAEEIENLEGVFRYDHDRTIRQIEKKLGIRHDIEAQKASYLLAENAAVDVFDPSQVAGIREDVVASAQLRRNFYQGLEKKFVDAGIEPTIFKQAYGGKAMFSSSQIKKNIKQYTELRFNDLKKLASNATRRLNAIENKIKETEGLVDTLSGLGKRNAIKQIAKLNAQKEEIRFFEIATEEELYDVASMVALNHSMGMFNSPITTNIAKLDPGVFKSRDLDIEKYIDFLNVNPYEQAKSYMMETRGFYGLKKVTGFDNLDEFLEDYKKSATLEGLDTGELSARTKDIQTGWRQLTGEFFQQTPEYFGGGRMADFLNSFADFTRVVMLGGQTLASLVEPLAIGLHRGIKGYAGFSKTLSNTVASKEFRELTKEQARQLRFGMQVAYAKMSIDDLSIEYGSAATNGRVSKYSSTAARKFQLFNGAAYWDDFSRTTLVATQDYAIADGIQRLVSGKNISKAEIGDLAFLGVDEANGLKIKKMLDQYASEIQGGFVSNFEKWTDTEAKDLYKQLLIKDLRRTSVMGDTGDVPFFTKTPLGRLMFMFRGWPITATQKYTISALQRPDANTMVGVTTMVGVGTLVAALKRKAEGQDDPETYDFDELLFEGINRAGIFGVLPDFGGNYVISKLFDVNTGIGRIADFQEPEEFILGAPTAVIKDIGTIASYPFDEIDRYNQGKDPKGIESIYDNVWDLMPLIYPIEGIVKDEIKEYQEQNK